MKKNLLFLLVMLLALSYSRAQTITNNFFQRVSYVGAFDGITNWLEGWTNWDPVNTNYPAATITKGNGQFTRGGGMHITANETWSGVIKLDGWVYVGAGATLTIEPGTIIRGTSQSVLSVERGGKIMAIGTRALPIVFTSNQGAGFRASSNWGGLVINGYGINNLAGGTGTAEGGIGSEYGGNNNEDNSGVLAFVRIEFPGHEVAIGSEVNGLTLNSVGNGTRIEYVQVSYSGDDGYEWFGGAVNAKYLISYRTEDDDFDTDNGFIGMVQFGLIQRDPAIVDTDTANAFESDNNSAGTDLTPATKAIFSNISAFGASKDLATFTANPQNHKDGATFRIRRASRLSIYNSLFLGWGKGVRLESSFTHNAAASDELAIKNNIIGGVYGKKYGDASTLTDAQIETWYLDAARKNKMLASDADAKIGNPFSLTAPNFQPQAGSPVFNASYWYVSNAANSINNNFFQRVSYVGAFDGITNWLEGWTNWDPVNTNYPAATITKGNGQFTRAGGMHITANETWSGVIKLDGWVYVDPGATLTIEPGTIIRGTTQSVLSVERGGKILAIGTRTLPIVFTSNQGAGFRASSNWGGLVINGYGINNLAGGTGTAEGGIGSEYGGTNNEDNSGVLAFVRIEFPGHEVATGSEVNGLTLNSVGNGTRIEYVQVSYSGDDGYEWFGGAVNAKYLISYRTEDDDFDTDNGYIGMVQFGLIQRDPAIVDTDTANAFESDNNKDGTDLAPATKAIFSNISAFGASKDLATYTANPQNHKDGATFRIRRASRLSIYNSLFLGWGKGVRLESAFTHNAAASDELAIKNNIIGGVYGKKYGDASTLTEAQIEAWYLDAARKNKMLASDADAKIGNPFSLTTPNFQPQAGSPVFNASYWYVSNAANSINNNFFQRVSYVGAFDGITNWLEGWTNWDPVNTNYPAATITKGNGQFTRAGGMHITANETWSGVIKLDGWVYVVAGATLTIEPGTIIRGTSQSVLSVERGGKIMAIGTRTLPIVFTSNQGAGFRASSNWGGLVINGYGINNLAGGTGTAEGGIGSEYGGTNNEDNSGVLAFVRIEFPGHEVATGSEVNGLTLNSVGNGTRIEYVQVSYSGDDGYEWFGGAVNARYLISYRTEDDDFDTDNGYIGMVQFGLIQRDPAIVDTDTANAFESDNNKDGTDLAPATKAIFSNISAFGASKDLATYTANPQNHKDGATFRIRRASRLSIYNSLFLGWGKGVRLESSFTHNAAASDELAIKNNIIGGVYGKKYGDASTLTEAQIETWYLDAARKNKMLASDADAKIGNPFSLTSPNFQPQAGSPVFNASYWVTTGSSKISSGINNLALDNYPNPFSGYTTIQVSVENNTEVNLTVWSLSGTRVSVLHSGGLTKGQHSFRFDAQNLPGGIYIARLVSGSRIQSLKMVSQ